MIFKGQPSKTHLIGGLLTLCLMNPLTLSANEGLPAEINNQLSTPQIIKSPNDSRDYYAFTLENGLKVLLISDLEADQATASLDVSVGSGNDPKDRQGLAHFLEHMLFLGTEKYPQAGEYQSYISNHGGRHNAFTAYDRTNYFFTIDNRYFEPALDRFAQFFISPLFTPDYVQREMQAVNSEYQSKLKEDGRRSYSVFKQVVNPEHPMAKFAVGNLDTLADRPDAPIREQLIQLYQQYYSTDQMTLVVSGNQTLNQLQQLVTEKFIAIAQRHTTKPTVTAPLFQPDALPALVKTKSLKETHNLNLTFPIPPVTLYYETKPLHYLSALLGHEGEGSLLDVLKDKGWAKGLSAGLGANYDDSATLVMNVNLTPEGFSQYQQVIGLSFQYLRLIADKGIQARIFNEEKQIQETEFRFKENGNNLSYSTHLARNLKRYPIDQVIYGDFAYERFDPVLIKDYLSYLTPSNVLVSLAAADVDTNKVDPWYKTNYSVDKISPSQVSLWQQQAINSAFKIPAPNQFLAADLELRDGIPTAHPKLLRERNGYRLWYQQDQDFKTPKADFYFTFRSPIANDSPRHNMMTALFVSLVKDQLNSFIYPANIAGFRTKIYDHIRGFGLRLSGYRDRETLLLDRITETIRTLKVDPDRLEIFATDLKRRLENSRKNKPYTQTIQKVYISLLKPQWSVDEKLQALEGIDAEELQQFIEQLLSSGEIEALAHGDLLAKDALALSQVLEDQLLASMKPVEVKRPEVQLLADSVAVQELDIDHNDSAISTYLQAADSSFDSRARYALLAEILSPNFYNQLRTEKQLGYIVFASAMPILEHPGLAFVIQSPSASASELQQHIDEFIAESQNLIEAVTDTQLQEFKQSLLVNLLKKDQKLSDRSNRYWQEVDRNYLEFNSRELLATAINKVTLTDLINTYQSINSRQLVVLSSGQKTSQAPTTRPKQDS